MTNQLIIETPRLLMRPMVTADWSLFHRLETDSSVQKYVSDLKDNSSIKQRFESRLPLWSKTGSQWLCLIITEKSSSKPIGITGFYPEWEPCRQAEVGFMLLPDYQNKGFGKESLLALARYAFEECRFHKLKATVTEGNDACCQLLKNIGFQQEARLRDNYRIAGQWQNDLVFGLLHHEFDR